MKKTRLASCSKQQAWMLEQFPHLIPLTYLEDGALLVVDSHHGVPTPFIMAVDGFLHEVAYYFDVYPNANERQIRDAITAYQIPFSELDGQTVEYPTRRPLAKVPPRKIANLQSEMRRLAEDLNASLYASKKADLPKVHGPADAAEILTPLLAPLEREELWVMCLDTRNRVIHLARIYSGSVNQSQVRLGEVFRPAILETATSILAAHNHPSGDPTPSPEDVSITRALVQAGKLLDIEVVDHLIFGATSFVSLKERGLGFS